jgi:hypothetical protein
MRLLVGVTGLDIYSCIRGGRFIWLVPARLLPQSRPIEPPTNNRTADHDAAQHQVRGHFFGQPADGSSRRDAKYENRYDEAPPQ